MKKQMLWVLAMPLITLASIAPQTYNKKLNSDGICFTENKGQVYDQNYKPRPDVLFGAMAGEMAVHIKNNGVSYQLYRIDSYKDVIDKRTNKTRKQIDGQTIYRIDLNWLNANTNFITSTDEAIPGYNNYYLESCPNGALNVKSYTGITLKNIYNGINLHYYSKEGNLKHDYIVSPHADYNQIKLEIKGAEVNVNKDGSLILKTPLGQVMEGAPIVFQNGKQLKAQWLVKNNVLSFEINNYNPNYELIIDPVTRLWSTYYGGAGVDYGNSCITDALGNVYMAGATVSNMNISTSGAHQTTFGGIFDAYVVKFNSAGVRQWGTYYGGSGDDGGFFCSTDASGNVYVSGETNSNINIATAGAHQTAFGGGNYDAYLVKFNSAGVRQWGTYYGGSGDDFGNSCNIDASGNVYLTGQTSSNTNIATAGAHQTTFNGGSNDAYLVKFNSSGVRQWGTYYGGSGDDFGYSCITDVSGNAYMTGETSSNTNIATAGAHQTTSGGGSSDAFLVKFNTTGVRQWGTYYGGSGDDFGISCITDASGNVYVSGITSSLASISTSGAHQTTFGGGNVDAFLVKFNSSGVRQWGTYYGGSGNDFGWICITDASGNVYMTGGTNSNTNIATAGAHQTAFGGGNDDAYLVKFNTAGVRQWGTYYGGTGVDFGYSCSTDATGNVYMSGDTDSNANIATAGAHQTTFGGATEDAFLVKFSQCIVINPIATVNATVCAGAALNFTASISGTITPTYSWSGPNSFTSNIQNPVIANASTLNIGTYTLTINNGGCIETATTQITLVSPCTGINENSNNALLFNAFPNPFNDELTIDVNEPSQITITNALGQVVKTVNVNGPIKLDTEDLPKGIYVLCVKTQYATRTIKMIKE